MQAMAIVALCFALSLVGAVVLFKFLKSSALVKNKSYRAGGALAGFVIIYGVLFGSILKIEQLKTGELSQELDSARKQLEITVVSGAVEPDKGPLKVRLVFDAQVPDSTEGRFNFNVPRVVLDDPGIAVYAVTDDDHVILDNNCDGPQCELPESSLYLYHQANLADIKIPVRLKKK
jgi:hypothetical protein